MLRDFDDVDRTILDRLVQDGRATWTDVAAELDLTAPAIANRVRRLSEKGAIRGFTALVDSDAFHPVHALAIVLADGPGAERELMEAVEASPWIPECLRVSGTGSHFLRIRCRTIDELERLLTNSIGSLAGVTIIETRLSLRTVKDAPVRIPDGAA